MRRKYSHLTYKERILISIRLRDKVPVIKIAKELGCSRATIYAEIKKATYNHKTPDWIYEKRYSPDQAQKLYEEKLSAKGPKLKIDKDIKLANFIENTIINKKYSPEAVLSLIKRDNLSFDVEIKSVNTIYSYIKKGVFYGLTMKHLPNKDKKRKKKVIRDFKNKRLKGTSIEHRPEHINNRSEFGHWEMDTVIGQIRNKKVLLVLTERKTRFEIIEVLKYKKIKDVQKALDRIEKRYGADFYKLFKSITVDNGIEFSNPEALENAFRRKNKRTEVYYCHPFCSSERGSNENQNKLIRRFFPKYSNFDKTVTIKKAKFVESWMNNYPREIFKGNCPNLYFDLEFKKIKEKDKNIAKDERAG